MFKYKMFSQNIPILIQNVKFKHSSSNEYERAIECLNGLTSNPATIRNAIQSQSVSGLKMDHARNHLIRSGITLDQLDRLSVIHVAGTKGKGSVCAFCESILRQHGLKTGFYSSPHLITVRERIRINGIPLSQDVFARYFFELYDELQAKKEQEDDMPPYFYFLTLMAFRVFLAEDVDVAVLEVGIGGEYDCTNIVRNTLIGGISSLGFDHEALLGNTIEEIAWNKSGIMKSGSKVFTVQQPAEAMKVLRSRSAERKCTLSLVPNYNDYKFEGPKLQLGINGEVQKINASLAIQLAHAWLHKNDILVKCYENNLCVPECTKQGLANCKWPGRYQILHLQNASIYLDGAHTIDSIALCVDWFKTVSQPKSNKVLIFNKTGTRNPEPMLKKLHSINFDSVYFVPNVCSCTMFADQPGLQNLSESCENHRQIWLSLRELQASKPYAQTVDVASNVEEIFHGLSADTHSEVLVTGSLHLIGAALALLDPDLKSF